MSRLYGKSNDVYSISKLLTDSKIKPYTIKKNRIHEEELETVIILAEINKNGCYFL